MIANDLPGADLVQRGLRDLEHGADSVEAFLVSMSAPRLRALGIAVPAPVSPTRNAPHSWTRTSRACSRACSRRT